MLIWEILGLRSQWGFEVIQKLAFVTLIGLLPLVGCALKTEPKAPEPYSGREEIANEISQIGGPSVAGNGIQAPTQPESGPAGRDYAHKSFKRTEIDFGTGGNTIVEIREPAEPAPSSAPVVFFFHGWTTEELIEGGRFQPFLEHLAKHGYVSVLVRYGDRMMIPAHMTNQAKGVQAALDYLSSKGSVKPDGRVAFTGASLGGSYIFQLAHNAERLGIPVPKVIGAFDPAGDFIVNVRNLSKIPTSTRVVIVPSETEDVPFGGQAFPVIWRAIDHIASEKRLLIMPLNDGHGSQKIYSNHSSCINARPAWQIDQGLINAEDWYGCWKPVVGAIDYEFGRGDKIYVDPSNPEVRNMGRWSDGVAVKPALINEEVLSRSMSRR